MASPGASSRSAETCWPWNQEGAIASEWDASENNRRARFYRLTREGRKQLQVETQDWEQTAAIIARFFEVKAEDLS
jgi:PadR family transcriptional regulator, regulatory protein PadR